MKASKRWREKAHDKTDSLIRTDPEHIVSKELLTKHQSPMELMVQPDDRHPDITTYLDRTPAATANFVGTIVDGLIGFENAASSLAT